MVSKLWELRLTEMPLRNAMVLRISCNVDVLAVGCVWQSAGCQLIWQVHLGDGNAFASRFAFNLIISAPTEDLRPSNHGTASSKLTHASVPEVNINGYKISHLRAPRFLLMNKFIT